MSIISAMGFGDSRPRNPISNYDVIVVGGGPSGFIASIAAAQTGAKTLLVERYGFFGGTPTNVSVGPMSTFYFGDEQVIEGIPQKFVDRMVAAGGATGHLKMTNTFGSGSYVCLYNREVYKWITLQMVLEAGVEILFHSQFVDAIVENGRICGIVVANKSGLQTYTAQVIIDATGDGDVAAAANSRFVVGRLKDHTLQPATLMFEMANVDTDKVKRYMDENPNEFEWASEIVALHSFDPNLQQEHYVGQGFRNLVKQGFNSGDLYLGRDTILFFTTVHPGVLHFNSTRVINLDGTKVKDLTRGEIDARKQVMSLSSFLIKNVPGFQKAYLSHTGAQIGIRETRHILGEYVLTEKDIISGQKFVDVVCRGCFPIDIHNTKGKRTTYREIATGRGSWVDLEDSYDVPYRCLIPMGVEYLIVAGRAISATHEATGSSRTQGCVMGVGQAAGTAAALSVLHKTSPRQLNIQLLQKRLESDGASIHRNKEKMAKQQDIAKTAIRKALEEKRITGLYMGKN